MKEGAQVTTHVNPANGNSFCEEIFRAKKKPRRKRAKSVGTSDDQPKPAALSLPRWAAGRHLCGDCGLIPEAPAAHERRPSSVSGPRPDTLSTICPSGAARFQDGTVNEPASSPTALIESGSGIVQGTRRASRLPKRIGDRLCHRVATRKRRQAVEILDRVQHGVMIDTLAVIAGNHAGTDYDCRDQVDVPLRGGRAGVILDRCVCVLVLVPGDDQQT